MVSYFVVKRVLTLSYFINFTRSFFGVVLYEVYYITGGHCFAVSMCPPQNKTVKPKHKTIKPKQSSQNP
jgi:hypothetical protein